MKNRELILIYIIAAVMVVVSVGVYLSKDRKAPEIVFGENAPVYSGDANDPSLLSNVNAYDNKDGDVSASVYVDSVLLSNDNKSAVVTYVAMDRGNNVMRESQTLSCTSDAASAEEKKENK